MHASAGTAGFEVEHLIHACVVCSDFDRSLDFYTRLCGATVHGEVMDLDMGAALADFLGFEGDSRCRAVFLKWGHDSTFVDLQQYYEPGGRVLRTTKDIGLARLALRVDDADAAEAWFRAAGIPIVGVMRDLGGRRRKGFSVRDPDGVLVELLEYLELSEARRGAKQT